MGWRLNWRCLGGQGNLEREGHNLKMQHYLENMLYYNLQQVLYVFRFVGWVFLILGMITLDSIE